MNIAQLLANAAMTHGDRPAVCVGSRHLCSYVELAGRASRLAASLITRFSMSPGDRVAIVMTNTPEYIEALFGIWWAGLVSVPINARLHPREIAYILENSNSRVCLLTADLEDTVGKLAGTIGNVKAFISAGSQEYRALLAGEGANLVPVSSGEPAWLFFTSGTTGHPKGATLTHRNLMMMSLSYLADITPVTPEHTIVHAAPLSHGTGLLTIPHVAKASKNVLLDSRSLDHDEIFRLFDTYQQITMYHTPTMLKRLVNHRGLAGARLDSLRAVFYGGSPMYLADLRQAIDRLGPRLVQMWAQAETPNTGTYLGIDDHMNRAHPRYIERLSSAGIVRTGVELRIGDDKDDAVPVGEVGEILVRGDTVMQGYWAAPEATAMTLRNGWLHTGDVGSLDADGYLTIKDRAKDMIISGGFNIYPREIEEVLQRHPDVAEVSVIGRPHADLVEEVVACVVRREGSQLSAADLDALCLENIARFKRPRDYHFLAELPKSYYGKVLKRELKVSLEKPRS